jgi:hypothetical protein
MEPEGSQEPFTGPYPEPDQSIPFSLAKLNLLYYPPTYIFLFLVVPPFVLQALPI